MDIDYMASHKMVNYALDIDQWCYGHIKAILQLSILKLHHLQFLE